MSARRLTPEERRERDAARATSMRRSVAMLEAALRVLDVEVAALHRDGMARHAPHIFHVLRITGAMRATVAALRWRADALDGEQRR